MVTELDRKLLRSTITTRSPEGTKWSQESFAVPVPVSHVKRARERDRDTVQAVDATNLHPHPMKLPTSSVPQKWLSPQVSTRISVSEFGFLVLRFYPRIPRTLHHPIPPLLHAHIFPLSHRRQLHLRAQLGQALLVQASATNEARMGARS